MKKNILKKSTAIISALVLAVMPINIYAEDAVSDFYPDAVYSDESAFDANGKWIYRELAVGGDCEDASLIWNNGSTNVTDAELDTTIKHSGNASIKQTFSKTYQYMGLPLDEAWVENDTYRVSYWFYTDTALASGNLSNYLAYGRVGKSSIGKMEVAYSSAVTANEWNFIDSKIQFQRASADVSNSVAIDTSKTSYASFVTNKQDTRYLDDMSVRRVPADLESFPKSYAKSITLKDSEGNAKDGDALLKSGDKIIFTYSLDVDKRTVGKENISVNGIKNASTIASVAYSVNDATRETTVTVVLGSVKADSEYTVSLDDIKDAWGRAVVGTTSFTFSTAPIIETEIVLEKDGEEITELEEGVIKAYFTLSSNVGEINAQLVAAVCSGNKFTSVTPKTVTIPVVPAVSGTEREPDFTLNVQAGETVRFFIWTDGEYPYPLSAMRIFDETGLNKAQY